MVSLRLWNLKNTFSATYLLLITSALNPVWSNDWDSKRQVLINEINEDVRLTARYIDKRDLNPQVMKSISITPRHEFVPKHLRRYAYDNRPLPIGFGQTISQPYIVALMTDLLNTDPSHIVLEVGTGSGYQAAILAPLVTQVYSIEIVEPLEKSAKERLGRLGYENITVKRGDGFYGWPEHGPFDSIIVTAASGQIPPPLIKQLKNGGRMVIPVGGPFSVQYLMLVEKDDDGKVFTRHVLPVRFVPLTGGH